MVVHPRRQITFPRSQKDLASILLAACLALLGCGDGCHPGVERTDAGPILELDSCPVAQLSPPGRRVAPGAGFVVIDFGYGSSAQAVAVDQVGRIVVAGLATPDDEGGAFALARLLPGGTLDPTFGSQGRISRKVVTRSDGAFALSIQLDGKIVAVGLSEGVPLDAGTRQIFGFAVARFLQDGTLDPGFGQAGAILTAFADPEWQAFGHAVAGGDGITVAGGCSLPASSYHICLASYLTSDGSPDPSFADGGILVVRPESLLPAQASSVQVTPCPEGRCIVFAGVGQTPTGHFRYILGRLLPGGRLDPTFGQDGLVMDSRLLEPATENNAESVVVTDNGRSLLIGGWESHSEAYPGDEAHSHDFVAKHTADGALDRSFGCDGMSKFQIGGGALRGIVSRPDGRILATGVAGGLTPPAFSPNYQVFVVQLQADGSIDTTFGNGGGVLVQTDEDVTDDEAYSIALLADGSVVLAGRTRVGNPSFLVVKLRPDGSVDETFGQP